MNTSLANWADFAYSLAVKAGESILHYYAHTDLLNTEYKADNSPLTQADKASHDIIYDGLSQFDLDIHGPAPVLSEEGQTIDFAVRKTWQRYWCVDPLDGTREFLAHNDEFAVNIALIENHQPIIGIIYIPTQKLGFLAWRGGGAYRCEANGMRHLMQTKRPPHQPFRVMVSRHCNVMRLRTLFSLGETQVVHQGSASKFGYLADGEADMMLRLTPTSEWDNAAGQCLVEEAGGAVYAINGQPLTYNQSDSLEQGRFIAVGDQSIQWSNLLELLNKI
ncbi:MAG: 3'(2'),5'-bisphosphate nucleotidase CysQ [Gammaproteobacteria bacterium]|jgi:3'(2'), 5'-bisphosphate nucleotidase|nr:3'(2'),5'-bisphosphate nucleotidase CysQ [Gammaproteobacteria bacterium]